MNLVESEVGDVVILIIEGDVDAGSAPDVEQRLRELMQSAKYKLVLDLGGVPYVSSAFLRVVLAAARDLRRQGGDLRLANPQYPVRSVFDLAGFSGLLKIYDNVPSAVSSYRT